MKIVFIENRYRTLFWDAVAGHLASQGHEIVFIVQNHRFHPANGKTIVLPYPRKKDLSAPCAADNELIVSDRNINYFGHRSTGHYSYYRRVIGELLEKEQPQVVFGESTAFHELITIDLCKSLSIPYFQPSTCRFPVGRFSFYRYDTLEPFSGSGEVLGDEEAVALIDRIVHRTIKPDYMKKRKQTLGTRWARLKDLAQLSLSYIGGEHYNTPAPWVKARIERQRKALIRQWDELAESRRELLSGTSRFKLLYPMQMQPEANLDVWGRPFRNQLDNIRQIIANTPDDVLVVVKPNPKSKYELTTELLDYMAGERRVIPILHSTPMDAVLPLADLVVTATGTVAIECILSDIPVVTLIKTMNNDMQNCPWLKSFDVLSGWVGRVRSNSFPKTTQREKVDFINRLNRTSFRGIPYETAMREENVVDCMRGFNNILVELGK